MSALTLNSVAETLATNCVMIGHCDKADVVWTRDEFFTICDHMMNGNPPTDFMLVYRDKENRAKFARAKNTKMSRRASWAWDTITGRSKSKVGIGFYPSNHEGKTRWGAMDFDAHDGNALRPRGLALAAFDILRRQPQLFVILGTSGSEGWHLFAFTHEFHPIGDWTLLLKKVANLIGTEVRSGICEIFPNEAKAGALPYGIRAPGTWNPKTDALGLIASNSVALLLAETKRERKEYPFLYHTTNSVKAPQLHDREKSTFYRGLNGEWESLFAITQPHTRRNQLKTLVHHIFRQAGHEVALLNAEAQYKEARPAPQATLNEHLKEFDDLWIWTHQQWREKLSDVECETFDAFGTETERDIFRIVRNFARKAEIDQTGDFPFALENVAARTGVSYQYVSKLRIRLVEAGILKQTAPAITNRTAARFRWLLGVGADEPF
jgi:hypothetical protein